MDKDIPRKIKLQPNDPMNINTKISNTNKLN